MKRVCPVCVGSGGEVFELVQTYWQAFLYCPNCNRVFYDPERGHAVSSGKTVLFGSPLPGVLTT